jgi:O-antigen/teichoic acid export membrane protein
MERRRLLNEATTIGARVFGIAAGLITSAITARSLGVVDRGTFFYVVTLATLLAQFGHFGTTSANTYFLAQDAGLARRLLKWSIWLALATSFGISMLFLGGVELPLFAALAPVEGALWLPWLILGNLLLLMLGSMLAGMQAFTVLNSVQIAYQTLLIGGFFLVAARGPSPTAFLAASVAGVAVAALVQIVAVRRLGQAEIRLAIQPADWFRYGGRAFLILLVGAILPRLAIFFVKSLSPAEELGYYSVAVQGFDALLMVPGSLALVLFPAIMSRGKPMWHDCRREVWRMLAIVVALAAVAGPMMPFAVPIIFGQPFAPAALVVIAFLPGFVASGLAVVASQYLAALRYPRIVIQSWLVSAAVLAASCAALVPAYGALGAAVATSLAYCVLAALLLGGARKCLQEA